MSDCLSEMVISGRSLFFDVLVMHAAVQVILRGSTCSTEPSQVPSKRKNIHSKARINRTSNMSVNPRKYTHSYHHFRSVARHLLSHMLPADFDKARINFYRVTKLDKINSGRFTKPDQTLPIDPKVYTG